MATLGEQDAGKARFSAPPVSASASGEYVLIIDDDPSIVDLLATFLHDDEGLTVHTSYSVRELLDHTPPVPPGLILLDITLPDEDSDKLAFNLRRLPGWHNAPIVLCSGQDYLPRIAREVGAVAYLTKPFSLDALADLAHQYVPVISQNEDDDR
jgi:two-component system response regulator (stage 0 sporulation protein F)